MEGGNLGEANSNATHVHIAHPPPAVSDRCVHALLPACLPPPWAGRFATTAWEMAVIACARPSRAARAQSSQSPRGMNGGQRLVGPAAENAAERERPRPVHPPLQKRLVVPCANVNDGRKTKAGHKTDSQKKVRVCVGWLPRSWWRQGWIATVTCVLRRAVRRGAAPAVRLIDRRQLSAARHGRRARCGVGTCVPLARKSEGNQSPKSTPLRTCLVVCSRLNGVRRARARSPGWVAGKEKN